jgi:hypothetical protein
MLRFLSSLAFLALAASAVVGCANAESSEELASDEAPLTNAPGCSESTAPSSREVLVDLESLAGLECRAMHGSFAVLGWEGRTYYQFVSDARPECIGQLAAMRAAAWEHHGLRGIELTRCRSEATNVVVERDLVLETKWTLRSVTTEAPPQAGRPPEGPQTEPAR